MTRRLHIPEIVLDRSGSWPIRQQIYRQIAESIRRSETPCGAVLPSSRLLAKLLRVSRNTVVDAYERLLEAGLIETKAGSGVRVVQSAAQGVPDFSNLRRTARAAHYPLRMVQFEDRDGTALYLNARS